MEQLMMIEQIFTTLPQHYQPGIVTEPTSIYFSIDEVKRTVWLNPTECKVDEGRTTDSADCVCKTTEEFFLKVWNDGYRPGLSDFLSGKIKANKPDILQLFLKACGKG
jgi:putative sterol carrier protein